MISKENDVFLAYHGSYDKNGSKVLADEICDFLLSKGIKVYYFPKSQKDNYKSNIIEVMKSKVFILVCNENIKTLENGHIDRVDHYELSVEIDAFYSLAQAGESTAMVDSRVFVSGNYEGREGKEADLHELFKGRTHLFFNKELNEEKFVELYDWINSRINSKNPQPDSKNEFNNKKLTEEIKEVFAQRSSMQSHINLAGLVANSKRIRAIGISNSELTTKIDENAILHALQNGAEFDIVFLDPDSDFTANREQEEKLRPGRIRDITYNNIETAAFFKDDLEDCYKENYRLYKYKAIPRLNIILLDNIAILQYYANFTAGMKNPCFVLEKKDYSPLYEFCEQNFEKIKQESELIGDF